jgi:hypothetical protein
MALEPLRLDSKNCHILIVEADLWRCNITYSMQEMSIPN